MSQYPTCPHGHSHPTLPCIQCEIEDRQRRDREALIDEINQKAATASRIAQSRQSLRMKLQDHFDAIRERARREDNAEARAAYEECAGLIEEALASNLRAEETDLN